MSNATFRVGLAGLSRVDARHLLPALVGLDGRPAALVAVADADLGRAQAHLALLDTTAGRRAALDAGHILAADFAPDAVSLHDDAEAMIARGGLDAVVIAAGADRPAALAERALRHGLDVLLVAPSALADAEALLYLSDTLRAFECTLWPELPSGLLRPELLGAITGARATWNLSRSPRPEPTETEQMLWLTTALVTFLDMRSLHRTDVAVTGRGPERTVRVGWATAGGHRAEAEVRLGWPFGEGERAWLTLHGTGGQVDLPLALPSARTEPTPALLRGVLWHAERGSISLQPPLAPAAAYRTLVTEWVGACCARRPERAPVAYAVAAARMAADLAEAMRRAR
jgi:predicted dehydrogenase